MARRTLSDLYNEARAYLDTDDLNFPDDLLTLLMRRVWFQAVNMEAEWDFLLCDGEALWPANAERVPLTFTLPQFAGVPSRQAARLAWVRWGDAPLTCQATWRQGDLAYHNVSGTPQFWVEERDAGVRYLRLLPTPVTDGTTKVNVSMVLIPEFPLSVAGSFVDLPEEFDDALLQALLAEMYMREEDGDLYQFARSMFMEQMGSIKERWRKSVPQRVIVAADAVAPYATMSGKKPKLWDNEWYER